MLDMATPPLLTASRLSPDPPPPGVSEHLLRAPLRFYHYGVDGFRDHGWGCGFRTVQSILSWYSAEPPPAIPVLQRLLDEQSVGSTGWIGVPDAVVLLDELHGAPLQIRTLASGRQLEAHMEALAAHFDGGGGPVMVGGTVDVYSKTVVGVRRGGAERGVLLVLDPHYSGPAALAAEAEPSRRALWSGGWVAWKPLSVLRADSMYNLGLPGAATCGTAVSAPPADTDTNWASLIEVVDASPG